MKEDEIRGLFRGMREEPVPLESLVRVRVLVEDRIRRRAPWKIAAWAMAFAALSIAAFVIQMQPAVRKMASPPVAVHPPAETPPPVEEAVTVRPAIVRRAERLQQSALQKQEGWKSEYASCTKIY